MNYKETILLPKTEFPMRADLVKREPEMLADWERSGLYARIQDARKDAPLFVLHDGPPFANGDVHMGTALNKILKDLVVKSRTMLGFRAPFIPGWDCHGLPIEFKVVKESRGLSAVEVRRRSEEYARKYIDIQRRQFKRLGVFGDWDNPYLTLDPAYEAEEIRAFAELVGKGLVYQAKRPVQWSTGARTALAEAEVEYIDRHDPAIWVEFPIVSGPLAGSASMVIWTTTPWTLPSNVAIAVDPGARYSARSFRLAGGSAKRLVIADALLESFIGSAAAVVDDASEPVRFTGSELAGTEAQHPFLDRRAVVITAGFVTLDTGTGQVHIAPGHGADDYIAGRENNLPLLSPVDDDGRFTAEAGMPELTGQYVFDANETIIDILGARQRLLHREDYAHSYPHCWRSKTPVIFRSVEQWFIRLDGLRNAALAEIDKVEWLPHWGRNRIYGTVESRPDWCISRQRTWGVPLPVFYAPDGAPILDAGVIRKVAGLVADHGTNIWFELDDAAIADRLGLPAGTTRRHDTLDVWIDSGFSHQAVLRRHPALRFPADLYLEATDQHRGWFQSSLLTSIALNGRSPYAACLTHGFVVDVDGRKISKSGSYEKPMDAGHFVNNHGADIIRLWVSSVNFTDDVPFSEEMFTRLADTYRRIRNTLRILLANLHDFDPAAHAAPADTMTTIDRWTLHQLNGVIRTCRSGYESHEFHRVYHALNQFCAVDLSSLYVDITKDRMYCDAADSARRRATQTVMHAVLRRLAPLLAPILAFTADEAWGFMGNAQSVHLELLPEPEPAWEAPDIAARVARLLDVRTRVGQAVELARQEKTIGKSLEAAVTVQVADPALRAQLESAIEEAEEFFIVGSLAVEAAGTNAASLVRSPHAKCDRCWRHRPDVGASADHPALCSRCESVVAGIAAAGAGS